MLVNFLPTLIVGVTINNGLCVDMHHLYNDTIFKNLSIIYKCVNTTESFVHPSLHLFSYLDPAIHIIRFLLITSIFEDLFVPERMFASVVINMFQLLVGLSYHFMMNKAYLLLILHHKMT